MVPKSILTTIQLNPVIQFNLIFRQDTWSIITAPKLSKCPLEGRDHLHWASQLQLLRNRSRNQGEKNRKTFRKHKPYPFK